MKQGMIRIDLSVDYEDNISNETIIRNDMNNSELQLEAIYEMVYGDNGKGRFTHDELIDKLAELYDAEQEGFMLSNENRNMAKPLEGKGYSLNQIGIIANGFDEST